MSTGHPLRKLKIILNPEEWHGRASETVWAEKVAGDRYRIRNAPFLAKGIGLLDVVNTVDHGCELVYKSTSISSGHSTYRLSPLDFDNRTLFEEYWEPLEALGCSFESAMPAMRLLSVDVPPTANIHQVYRLLEAGEAGGAWEFEEGHCAHSKGI